MALPTIQPTTIKCGPGRIYYAPLGTAIPTLTAASSILSGAWTSWVEVGATDSGLTYSESTDVTPVNVAESKYPVFTIVTGKTASVSFTVTHIHTLNWKLVSNGGTVTVTGTGATKLDVYVPPLADAEVKIMLGFQSLDNTEAFVWPQCFNTGGFETSRAGWAEKNVLPATFSVELPDPAVLTTPYKRWTAGALATGV